MNLKFYLLCYVDPGKKSVGHISSDRKYNPGRQMNKKICYFFTAAFSSSIYNDCTHLSVSLWQFEMDFELTTPHMFFFRQVLYLNFARQNPNLSTSNSLFCRENVDTFDTFETELMRTLPHKLL